MSNVASISAARARTPQFDIENLAITYLFRVRWESRIYALKYCIDQLVINHDMTEENAEIAAIQAYADLESTNQVARIDMNTTTSSVVILRTEGNRPVMFTVADLVRVLEQARTEGRAVVVDRERQRPVVFEQ